MGGRITLVSKTSKASMEKGDVMMDDLAPFVVVVSNVAALNTVVVVVVVVDRTFNGRLLYHDKWRMWNECR